MYRSEWVCLSVNVINSNNDVRICAINKAINTVKYPLLTVEEVLRSVANAKVFSKLAYQQEFLHLPLDKNSKQYATINPSEGLFRFNYLPFGVASSPAIFQSYISMILAGISNIIIYQDDLLILHPDVENHIETLDIVLNRLQSAGIKLNTKKGSFFCRIC